jgi:putative zinc finger/helix-turn-helix YgiT family protein
MASTPSASHSMTTEERFCPYCEKTTPVHEVTEPEILPVHGEPVEYVAHLYHCDTCNQDFATQAQEETNFETAYDIYRQRHNLLSPAQIRAIRKKYGLSQTNMALLLGWGGITIHRYENGSLPDTAHNELLVLLDDPQNARRILNLNKADLPEGLVRDLSETIDSLIGNEGDRLKSLFSLFDAESVSLPDVNTGYKAFRLEKFENLVLYLLHKCTDVYKTKLNKLLWYCDFGYFQRETVSLTGARYVHLPFGPVPDNYEVYLWKLHSEKKIKSIERVFSSCAGEILIPLAPVGPRAFTASELAAVDDVVRKLGSMSAKALSGKSHKERAYVETGEMDTIPYTYAVDLVMQPIKQRREGAPE